MIELVTVSAMALLWWGPTFMGLSDLQRRQGVPRVLVWKWTAVLCIPVVGALLYFKKGRNELERARDRAA